MRAIAVVLSLFALAGCESMYKPSMSSFDTTDKGGFVFSADSDPMMWPTNSTAGENARMDWLKSYLTDNHMCAAGYAIDKRKVVALSSTQDRITYEGHCV